MWAANYDSVIEQLAAEGLVIDPALGLQVGAATFMRCKVDGRLGKPGWYKLYLLDAPNGGLICGSFGVWSGDDDGARNVAIKREDLPQLTPEQVAARKARWLADKKEAAETLRRSHEAAAAEASEWWRDCKANGGASEYLTRKGLPPGNLYGARLSTAGNLVVPVQDVAGRTWGLQLIYSDPAVKERKKRDKDFAPRGLAKKGHFFVIGALMPGGIALLCEGFATGASLHEATGLAVVVGFDANNLAPVALAVARRYRGLRILICADDDYLQTCSACKAWTTVAEADCIHCREPHGKRNTGIEAAKAAALPLQAGVVHPIFPGQRPITHKGPTDFNDLHTHPDGSLSMVARQIESSLSALGWRAKSSAPTRAAGAEQGEGDGARPAMRPIYTLDEAVERWTLLYGGAGAYFDAEDRVVVQKQDVLALIPDHASRDWKLRPDRKVSRFSGVGFDPTESDDKVTCNLWGGWPTKAKAGDCEILLELLRWLCSLESNADEVYQWALRWIAYPIQHPGAKLKTTLVFHGLQGAGKNLFFETVAAIYDEYAAVVDQRAIESQFTDWASKKLFAVFDEVVARNEVFGLKNLIKCLITGRQIRINPKNTAAWDETNHMNGVWLSNEDRPAAVELFDRRYLVIYTPPALSERYYMDVKRCLQHGGREALHHYLLHLDLGDFHEHSKPPMTRAKSDLQSISAGTVERFFIDWTKGDTRHPVCPCGSGQLYKAYQRWCGQQGEKFRAQNILSNYVGKQPGWDLDRKDIFSTAHYSGTASRTRMVLPPDDILSKTATQRADYRKKPDQTEAQWATDGYFAFHASLASGSVDGADD